MRVKNRPLRKHEKKQTSLEQVLWTNGAMKIGIVHTIGSPMVYTMDKAHDFMHTLLCTPTRHKRCKERGRCEHMEPQTDEEGSQHTGILLKDWIVMTISKRKAALDKAHTPAKQGFKDCRRVKLTIEEA